jgi:ribosomal-protein-alanine N-acetyltransferase
MTSVLETARLRLRPYTRDDIEPLRAVFADAYARQFYPLMGEAEKLAGWIEWNLLNYEHDGVGLWALEERGQPGRLIGDCGLTYQDVEGRRELELGWHLLESERGRGYATEAAQACLNYAFERLAVSMVCSIVDPTNVASRAVAGRVHAACREFVKNERTMLLYFTDGSARRLPTPTESAMPITALPLEAHVRRHIRAAPERVFDAWIDPTSIAQWFAPGLGTMVRIDVDPRVGGRFVFTQRRGDQDVEHTGEYLVFDRPRRLAFTWGVAKQPADFARIGIEVRPRDGGSDVTLTHELTPEWGTDFIERAQAAWTRMIGVIATLVE